MDLIERGAIIIYHRLNKMPPPKVAFLYRCPSIMLLVMMLSIGAAAQTKFVTVKGHVTDANSGAPLVGVNIVIQKTLLGTSTDGRGQYLLNVKAGNYHITFSCVGYEAVIKNVTLIGNETQFTLNVALNSSAYIMNDVTVNANRESGIQSFDTLKAIDIQNMPNLFSNVLSSIKILPGVTSNNELSSTYNVRGGNFDQNLIYLNGYEIFQPYLIQQGIEQSQSIINENMVHSMEFHHGAFPVQFGDKMSSALAVNYYTEERPDLGGELHADLFNLGLTLHDKTGNLSWRTGFRYAYPSLFDKTLQTEGVYKPRFDDFQFLGSYSFPNNAAVQVLFIKARNDFELTPQSWFGNFQTSALSIHQVTLDFAGNSNYTYNTNLAGIKFITPLTDHSHLTTSLAYCSDKEFYNTHLSYLANYTENVYPVAGTAQYLGTGEKFTDNSLNTKRIELQSDYTLSDKEQTIKAGMDIRYSKLESSLDESTSYRGADSAINTSHDAHQTLKTKFNSLSAYLEDNIFLSSKLSANAGLRALKYYFNGELLLSPRAGICYKPDTLNMLTLSWGYYYQPPYFYETWDKDLHTAKSLLAQRDVQYNLSWEYRFKEHSRFTTEVYYKNLSRLVPFYIDQLQLTYGDKNNFEGYAYGLDLQYEGELVRGLESWIGYGYLNAEQRETPGNFLYEKSPLDQTHTIRIFLQDHARSHPNYQSHVLFLLGSGYRYYPMVSVPGTSPGAYEIVPDYHVTNEYQFFFRVDMGLTFEFKAFDRTGITLTAEVLNVFNQNNVTSYSWFHIFQGATKAIPIPNILSPRYFNAGFKLDF
jgi:hypothetical protein